METRAPYVLIGSFVLAAIVAVFGFVYWLNNTGGIGPRTNYHVQFQGPVPGLLVGAGVLFNGIRVGEVTQLGLAPDNPRFVNATISVAATTPVRTDTKVGLDFQGLTGVPVVTLEGGMIVAKSGAPDLDRGGGRRPEHDAGRARRAAAGRHCARGQFRSAEGHHRQPQDILRRPRAQHRQDRRHPSGARENDGGGTPVQKVTYDLRAPRNPGPAGKTLSGSLAIPEPTAVAMLQTQRMLFAPSGDNPGFAEFLWADSIPKLVQARLIDSFENYDIAHAPLRTTELGAADYQLLIDIRRFRIATEGETRVEIGLSARIVDKSGKVVASRLIEASEKLDKVEPAAAVAAFDAAFARIARELIGWTVQAV